jgi:hypothetical protein
MNDKSKTGHEAGDVMPPLDVNILPTANSETEPDEKDYTKPDTYSERVTSENMIDAIIKTQDLG